MNNKIKQFSPHIYAEWGELFKTLNDKQKAEILMGITLFPNYEPDVPIWDFIKSQLEKDYELFVAKCNKNKEISRNYWNNKTKPNDIQTKPNDIQTKPNETERYPKLITNNEITNNELLLTKTNNIVEGISENLEPIKPIDPYTSDLIEKVFDIYTKECNNLCPLGGYARKNRSLREAISDYMYQTNNDIEYFTSICKKANELKIIADKKIDLKMILNCYEGIDNGKYIKTEVEEWSVNDLFKKEEK